MRTIIRAAAGTLAAGLAVSALAGCYIDAGSLQRHDHRYTVPGQVRTLVVTAHAGGIRVTGSQAATVVSVTEHITYRHTQPVTTHRLSGGTLTLDSSCPALETCGVGYTIRVPQAVTVQVSTGAGSVRLQSLAGKVTADTKAGSISLDSLSGQLEVTGVAGSVKGRRIASSLATFRTSAGSIDVSFSVAPAAVTATTTAGSLTLHVPGSVPYAVRVKATIGSTHIGVTRSPASAHVITASTRVGSVTIAPAP